MQSAWWTDELSGTTTQFINCGKFHWNVGMLLCLDFVEFVHLKTSVLSCFSQIHLFLKCFLWRHMWPVHLVQMQCLNQILAKDGESKRTWHCVVTFCSYADVEKHFVVLFLEILCRMAGHWPMLLSSRKFALLSALTGVACVLLPLLQSWKTRSTSLWVLTFRCSKSTAWARALVRHLFYHLCVIGSVTVLSFR